MPSDRTPLLVSPERRSSTDSAAEEEDSALTSTRGTRHGRLSGSPWATRLREIILFVWALLATAVVIVLAVWMQHNSQTGGGGDWKKPHKRNLIFMVSDGMGPASLSLTRSYRQFVEKRDINDTLTLDQHFWGTSRTRSTNSLVTDSAAGATAFSCGKKSYNGAIAMLPGFTPCGTVLEAAKREGYTTGLVVTTDITDATPACFAAHVNHREQNDDVALHEIGEGPLGRVVDLILGGGRCRFLPKSKQDSCRSDDIDVAKIAQKKHGWTYFDDRAGFDSMWEGKNASLPTMGLFASHDIPFEIDRRYMSDVYPSLSEMARTALTALEAATKDSDKGFFLMIEGSRIDHAGHFNDPAAQVREVLEYDKAFKEVVDFIEKTETDTLLVATSDHETGGLATAIQPPGRDPVYGWYPSFLAKANASAEHVSRLLSERVGSRAKKEGKGSLKTWINTELVINRLGVADARDEELDRLVDAAANGDGNSATEAFADIISLRAHIGWSTHGHTAVDVNIYSAGKRRKDAAEAIRGNVENIDIGKFLRGYLDVDVGPITKELEEKLGNDRSVDVAKTKTKKKNKKNKKKMQAPQMGPGWMHRAEE